MSNWRQPAKIRRQGRMAFYRHGNPDDHNPFLNEKSHVWFADVLAKHWKVGWSEAKIADDELIKMEQEAE